MQHRSGDEWRPEAHAYAFHLTMTLNDAGLVLGAGTVLAKCRLPSGTEDAGCRLCAAEHLLASGVGGRDLLKVCGIDTAAFDLLKAGFNPAQPRVPSGNPDGGQWTAAGGAANSDRYNTVKGTPKDAKAVITPDSEPISDPSSSTGLLLAPPRADYREYAAGRRIANSAFPDQLPHINASTGHGGTYDFQRDRAKRKLYLAYVNAANYSAGVYMAGAGYTHEDTLALAALYAFLHSSNYTTTSRFEWITRGWLDANAGRWK